MTFSAPTFVSCVRMSSWTPSTKKASSASRLRFSKGSTAIGGACVGGRRGDAPVSQPQPWSSSGRCAGAYQPQNARRRESSSSVSTASSGPRDSLLAAVAVVPGERHDDRQADRSPSIASLPDDAASRRRRRRTQTCSSTHAPAAYASPHWTTLRRRSLVQVLSASRSAGVSVNRRPPWRRSVAAYPRVRAGNRSTVTGGRYARRAEMGRLHQTTGCFGRSRAITISAGAPGGGAAT